MELFVNEATLLPVLVPLAPTATLLERFPFALAEIFADHGASPAFIAAEEGDDRVASRQDRQPQRRRHHERVRLPRRCVSEGGGPPSLLELSVRLAQTPCGPLYKRHLSPDRELTALLAGQQRPDRASTDT